MTYCLVMAKSDQDWFGSPWNWIRIEVKSRIWIRIDPQHDCTVYRTVLNVGEIHLTAFTQPDAGLLDPALTVCTLFLERLEELKMPTLQQRREEIDMTEMYKIMTGKSAVEPSIWFERVNRDGVLTTTRMAADPLNVKITAARLELRKNFFSVRVCEKWNNLPSEIKNSVNARSFKTSYMRHTGSKNPSQAADETGQDARE
jgi:hypothetical protein